MKTELILFGKESGCAPCSNVKDYLKEKGITEYTFYNPFEDIEQGIENNISTVPTLILHVNGKEIKRVLTDRNVKALDRLVELYNNERYL